MQQEDTQKVRQENLVRQEKLEQAEVFTLPPVPENLFGEAVPENLSGGEPSFPGKKKMKIVIRTENEDKEGLSIAEMVRNELVPKEDPEEIQSARSFMTRRVNTTVEKFFKQLDSELDTKASKKCLNCGSTRVCSNGKAQKTGEPRALCMQCNKAFPTRYALMFAEISSPRKPPAKKAEGASPKKQREEPAVHEAKKTEKAPPKKQRVEATPQEAKKMSVEKATEILSVPAPRKKPRKEAARQEKLAFLYVEKLPRNRIGLIKKALETKVKGVSTKDIANIAFIGDEMAEIIVYDKVAVMMKDGLKKINLKTCEWNPAGGEYGKTKFKERMKRLGERKGAPYTLTNLARKLATAEDKWLEKILAKCGVETGTSTLRKKTNSIDKKR